MPTATFNYTPAATSPNAPSPPPHAQSSPAPEPEAAEDAAKRISTSLPPVVGADGEKTNEIDTTEAVDGKTDKGDAKEDDGDMKESETPPVKEVDSEKTDEGEESLVSSGMKRKKEQIQDGSKKNKPLNAAVLATLLNIPQQQLQHQQQFGMHFNPQMIYPQQMMNGQMMNGQMMNGQMMHWGQQNVQMQEMMAAQAVNAASAQRMVVLIGSGNSNLVHAIPSGFTCHQVILMLPPPQIKLGMVFDDHPTLVFPELKSVAIDSPIRSQLPMEFHKDCFIVSLKSEAIGHVQPKCARKCAMLISKSQEGETKPVKLAMVLVKIKTDTLPRPPSGRNPSFPEGAYAYSKNMNTKQHANENDNEHSKNPSNGSKSTSTSPAEEADGADGAKINEGEMKEVDGEKTNEGDTKEVDDGKMDKGDAKEDDKDKKESETPPVKEVDSEKTDKGKESLVLSGKKKKKEQIQDGSKKNMPLNATVLATLPNNSQQQLQHQQQFGTHFNPQMIYPQQMMNGQMMHWGQQNLQMHNMMAAQAVNVANAQRMAVLMGSGNSNLVQAIPSGFTCHQVILTLPPPQIKLGMVFDDHPTLVFPELKSVAIDSPIRSQLPMAFHKDFFIVSLKSEVIGHVQPKSAQQCAMLISKSQEGKTEPVKLAMVLVKKKASFNSSVPTARSTNGTEKALTKKKTQRREKNPDRNIEVKRLALNYFCDSQRRNMKQICDDFGKAEVYRALRYFIESDVELMKVHSDMKRGNLDSRSVALKKVKELIPDSVDLSLFGKPNVNVKCSGLNNDDVAHYSEIDPLFCISHWDHSRGAWRSKKCLVDTHLDVASAVEMGWRKPPSNNDTYQCPRCKSASYNAKKYSEITSSSCLQAITTMLKNQVKLKYNSIVRGCENRIEGIKEFKDDSEVIQPMKMLASNDVMGVKCDEGRILVRSCGAEGCDEISVLQVRSNNAELCAACTRRKCSAEQSELRRKENYFKQVAHDSHTPYSYLTDEQKEERLKNKERAERSAKRTKR